MNSQANVALAFYINDQSNETQKIIIEWNDASKDEKSNVEIKVNDEKITGTENVARYLARARRDLDLYGFNAISTTLIDQWIDFALDKLGSSDFKVIEAALEEIDHHLTLRTFLVGYKLTLADIFVWGTLKNSPIFNRQLKTGKDVGVYLTRWYNYIGSLSFIQEGLKWVTKSIDTSKPRKDQPNMNIGLIDAEIGKVVTRFPPEP
ncbi:10920_t:CDS:2, partial [Acaulospora morrowiae]